MNDVRLSKLLSLVLRHRPETIGVTLDENGWLPIPELLTALAANGHEMTRSELHRVVEANDKQRFVIDHARDRIRANQGHSVSVDLGLVPTQPPYLLYHGTPARNLPSILSKGLTRRSRHAVHLSADVATAHKVGARRGEHVVLAIDAAAMHSDGLTFAISANGVWLTETVPARYLTVLDDATT